MFERNMRSMADIGMEFVHGGKALPEMREIYFVTEKEYHRICKLLTRYQWAVDNLRNACMLDSPEDRIRERDRIDKKLENENDSRGN